MVAARLARVPAGRSRNSLPSPWPHACCPWDRCSPLEGLLHRLMGREAGPFVMAVRRTQIGLEQVGAGLGQPFLGAIRHGGLSGGVRVPQVGWGGWKDDRGMEPLRRHRGRNWVEDLLCTTASRREWEARRSRAERRTADAMTDAAKDPEPLRVGSRGRHETASEAQPSQRTIGGLAQPLRPPAPCSRRSAQG